MRLIAAYWVRAHSQSLTGATWKQILPRWQGQSKSATCSPGWIQMLNYFQKRSFTELPFTPTTVHLITRASTIQFVSAQWLINTLTKAACSSLWEQKKRFCCLPFLLLLENSAVVRELRGRSWKACRQVCTFMHVVLRCLLPWWPPTSPHRTKWYFCKVWGHDFSVWYSCKEVRCRRNLSFLFFFSIFTAVWRYAGWRSHRKIQ